MDALCQVFKTIHQARGRAVKQVGVFQMDALIFDSRQARPFTPFIFTCLNMVFLDMEVIMKTSGHSDVRTTMIYTHTIKSMTIKEAKSLLDF